MKYLIAAALAALAAAGCGGSASYPASAHSASPAAAHGSAPQTCQQKVNAWRANSAASANYNQMNAVMSSIGHEAASGDFAAMLHGVTRLSNLAQQAETWPFPACADPHGLYSRGLSYLITAGDDAAGQSAAGLVQAAAAIHHAERLLGKLANSEPY
jgi:hypothetical protein